MSTISLQFDPDREQEELRAAERGILLKRSLQDLEVYLLKHGKHTTLDFLEKTYQSHNLIEYRDKLREIRRRAAG